MIIMTLVRDYSVSGSILMKIRLELILSQCGRLLTTKIFRRLLIIEQNSWKVQDHQGHLKPAILPYRVTAAGSMSPHIPRRKRKNRARICNAYDAYPSLRRVNEQQKNNHYEWDIRKWEEAR